MITKYTKKMELNESEKLNEEIQIGDTVILDKEKGYVIGQVEGKLLIQVQGSTHLVKPEELKETNKPPEIITQPHMKFDKKTQALLFEQYIKCGIYMGNVPVKMNDCYVRYSDWNEANEEQFINVLIEGFSQLMSKRQIKILQDINEIANQDNFVPGVIIDENTEDVVENILINAIDYTEAVGDADPIRVIVEGPQGQEFQSLPKSRVRTLSV